MTAMKKSTTILIAIFVTTLLFCFFAPIIFFRPVSPEEDESLSFTVKITNDGEPMDTTLKDFTKIMFDLSDDRELYDRYFNIANESGSLIHPILVIQEMKGIGAPRLLVNDGWKNVLEIHWEDSVLSIGIDYVNLILLTEEEDTETDGYYSKILDIVVPSGCEEIGVLQVPPGMLESISGDGGNIVLRDFKNAELNVAINYIYVDAENCSFKRYIVHKIN